VLGHQRARQDHGLIVVARRAARPSVERQHGAVEPGQSTEDEHGGDGHSGRGSEPTSISMATIFVHTMRIGISRPDMSAIPPCNARSTGASQQLQKGDMKV
jgi:hypothetical protein